MGGTLCKAFRLHVAARRNSLLTRLRQILSGYDEVTRSNGLHTLEESAGGVAHFLLNCRICIKLIVIGRIGLPIANVTVELRRGDVAGARRVRPAGRGAEAGCAREEIPHGISDEQVLFLDNIFLTGWGRRSDLSEHAAAVPLVHRVEQATMNSSAPIGQA